MENVLRFSCDDLPSQTSNVSHPLDGTIQRAMITTTLNREIICPNAHLKIHDVMHVASHRQLSVVDVNLFEASAPPTKVKHATSGP